MILSCLAIFGFAADTAPVYYIDSVNGDDSNSGTSENDAWKTIDNHT